MKWRGTIGDDSYTGSNRYNFLLGLGGDDLLRASTVNTKINGGVGNDQIYGNIGHDTLLGGEGDDVIYGGGGDDVVVAWSGDDFVDGGTGNDGIDGGDGDDQLDGQGGNDILSGGLGSDFLDGGSGNDILIGGYGADVMYGGSGADIFVLEYDQASEERQVDTIGEGYGFGMDRFEVGIDTIDLSSLGFVSDLDDIWIGKRMASYSNGNGGIVLTEISQIIYGRTVIAEVWASSLSVDDLVL